MGARRWLSWVLFGFAGLLTIERLLISVDLPAIYPVVWLGGQVVILVSFTVMWNAAAEAWTTRQAKRLYPLFASAGIVGGVVGNVLTGPLAYLLGTENLLVVQASLLVAGGFTAWTVGHRFSATRLESQNGRPYPTSEPVSTGSPNATPPSHDLGCRVDIGPLLPDGVPIRRDRDPVLRH